MIESPYKFEDALAPEQYQKLGQLSLKWSTLAHVIGVILATILRLSDDEATAVVFPLSVEQRMNLLKTLFESRSPPQAAAENFKELWACVKALQVVRNNVAHALLIKEPSAVFIYLRSKDRRFTLGEILSTEELTNYAGHVVRHLRVNLKLPGYHAVSAPLPNRPEIPAFLQSYFQEPRGQT